MEQRKKVWLGLAGIFAICFLLVYAFWPMTNEDILNKPNFTGVITEISDMYITVSVEKGDEEFKSSDVIWVSLNAKLKDSVEDLKAGDKVRVYYDGLIQETYPAQIPNAYAIFLADE